jgi:hypothetical protein
LFYGQYRYSLGFQLSEVSCLRELDHDYIDLIIERRRQWRQMSLQRWGLGTTRNILTNRARDISEDIVENLHTLTNLLLTCQIDFKLVTSVSSAWIYTNDLNLIEQVSNIDFIQYKTYTQAVVSRPKDTICLCNPRHQRRSYFGSHKLTDMEKINLTNFFQNQAEYIRISPSLENYLQGSFHRTQDYFFFDYTEDSWLLMLSLIRPGLIRKTLSIIAR